MIEQIYNESIIQRLLKGDNIREDRFKWNIKYYMKCFYRLSQANYSNILAVQIKTFGRDELNYTENYTKYSLIEYGKPRFPRKWKGIYIIEADLAIFVVSLDQFFVKLFEEIVKLIDTLSIFECTFNSKLHQRKKKVVLFTKVDFFVDKINEGVFVDKYFKGEKYSPWESFEFILNLFKSKYNEGATLQYHVVNLLNSKEAYDCIDCILNQSGRFVSTSLLLPQNQIINKLFRLTVTRNLSDIEICMYK